MKKDDNSDKIQDKKNKFNDIKTKVAGLVKGKGHLKDDLLIIGGVSADVGSPTLDGLEGSPLVKKIELDRKIKTVLDTSVNEISARPIWQLFDGRNANLTGLGEKIAISRAIVVGFGLRGQRLPNM